MYAVASAPDPEMNLTKALLKTLTLLVVAPALASAQAPAPRVYTDHDYAQAERFMPYNVDPLVFHGVEKPAWMPDGRMIYRDRGSKGFTFVVVDPVKGTKAAAFDQEKLATALGALNPAGPALKPYALPKIEDLALSPDNQTLQLNLNGRRISCDLSGPGLCKTLEGVPATTLEAGIRRTLTGEELSPDGSKLAFIRDWNLWLRDVATGKERQLTTDGVKDFGYATDNAGWQHSGQPILVWSPDSRRIATFQQDQRKTGEMYLTNTTYGHPTLTVLKYPLVGDKDVTMIERVVINLGKDDKPKIVRLKMPPDQHRSTLCDDIACKNGAWDDVQWAADSQSLAFVSTARDHKQEWMRLANPNNGDVRDVMGETVAKFYESGENKVNWHYLSASNELLWFSERDNWGHLYLYDIATGKLKTQITTGEWNVTQVLGIDQKARILYFLAVGKENGNDPYYPMYYKVGFDGTGLELLTPERADHVITPTADNRFFVDTFSTPVEPQVTVVRDAAGKTVVEVARQDITRLKATGWLAPVPIMVKARDGLTNTYGLLFRPSNFTTSGHYPIINHVYPGPQTGSCGNRTFMAAHGDLQSLAELGFIVVCIDGLGTPTRSKSFHEFYYGQLGDDTIPDQVAGMQDLSERYPWIDLDRVGIYGHSGGGNATASAMFHYPDFFKVGIAESGNHDNRNYEDDWAEKWAGLLVKNPDGTTNYDAQANWVGAKFLKGHLLLAHGTVDDNVPTSNTMLVVDALIKANKDFDLLLLPNERHKYLDSSPYMTRRRWDYFVTWLAGGTPPHEYRMKPYAETKEDQ